MSKRLSNQLLKGLLIVITWFAVTVHHAYSGPYSTFNTVTEKQVNTANYQGKDWSLMNISGQQVRLSQFVNQPVILVFWATWCPYCKQLLPGMERLHKKYADSGLIVLAVNIKEDWQPKTYWRNHQYSFDALLEGDDVAEIYGVTGTPTVVYISPAGKVLKVAQFSDPDHPSLEIFAQHFTSNVGVD